MLNDLIKDNCDVFIQSYRPDALNNRGFTPEKWRSFVRGSFVWMYPPTDMLVPGPDGKPGKILPKAAQVLWSIKAQLNRRKKYIRPFKEDLTRVLDPKIGDGFNDNVELMETDTPFGRLTHMAPLTKYSETPGYWERPTMPLGYHRAEWPKQM
jgi:hypothetical protein